MGKKILLLVLFILTVFSCQQKEKNNRTATEKEQTTRSVNIMKITLEDLITFEQIEQITGNKVNRIMSGNGDNETVSTQVKEHYRFETVSFRVNLKDPLRNLIVLVSRDEEQPGVMASAYEFFKKQDSGTVAIDSLGENAFFSPGLRRISGGVWVLSGKRYITITFKPALARDEYIRQGGAIAKVIAESLKRFPPREAGLE